MEQSPELPKQRIPDASVVELYHEEVPREAHEVMSDAAELEQRFIYGETADTVPESERQLMVREAAKIIDELDQAISTSTHVETAELAQSLKESLERYVGKRPGSPEPH